MNRSYARGRAFEYRVRDYFGSQGFFVVRQAKSSFPDLIALKKGTILFVECRVRGNLSKEERVTLLSLNKRLGSRAYIASRKGRKLLLRLVK